VTDEEKYAPERVIVDRLRTALAVEAWNREARRRARVDLYDTLTGREFTGTEQDPNAAFIVGLMQKHFYLLSRQRGVTVYAVPCIREESPAAVGEFTCVEEELDGDAHLALRRLREISDEVTETEETDEEGNPLKRYRFAVHSVWSRFIRRGHSYDEWLRLTYGPEEE